MHMHQGNWLGNALGIGSTLVICRTLWLRKLTRNQPPAQQSRPTPCKNGRIWHRQGERTRSPQGEGRTHGPRGSRRPTCRRTASRTASRTKPWGSSQRARSRPRPQGRGRPPRTGRAPCRWSWGRRGERIPGATLRRLVRHTKQPNRARAFQLVDVQPAAWTRPTRTRIAVHFHWLGALDAGRRDTPPPAVPGAPRRTRGQGPSHDNVAVVPQGALGTAPEDAPAGSRIHTKGRRIP